MGGVYLVCTQIFCNALQIFCNTSRVFATLCRFSGAYAIVKRTAKNFSLSVRWDLPFLRENYSFISKDYFWWEIHLKPWSAFHKLLLFSLFAKEESLTASCMAALDEKKNTKTGWCLGKGIDYYPCQFCALKIWYSYCLKLPLTVMTWVHMNNDVFGRHITVVINFCLCFGTQYSSYIRWGIPPL